MLTTTLMFGFAVLLHGGKEGTCIQRKRTHSDMLYNTFLTNPGSIPAAVPLRMSPRSKEPIRTSSLGMTKVP